MFSKQLFSDLVARCWGAQSEDVSVFRRFGQVARAVGESEQWCLICAGITDHLYMRNELWGFSPRHTNVSIPGNPLSDSIRQFLVKMPLISYICTKEQDWKCFSDQRPRFKLITQLARNAITWIRISVFVCTLLSNAQQRANISAFVTCRTAIARGQKSYHRKPSLPRKYVWCFGSSTWYSSVHQRIRKWSKSYYK